MTINFNYTNEETFTQSLNVVELAAKYSSHHTLLLLKAFDILALGTLTELMMEYGLY